MRNPAWSLDSKRLLTGEPVKGLFPTDPLRSVTKKVSLVKRNFKALANRNVISNPGNRANFRVNKLNQGERAGRTRANILSESKPEQIAFPVLT